MKPPAPPGIHHGQGVEVPELLRGMHPVVLGAATAHWVNGHRNEAIDRASVAVTELVKQLSGLSNEDGQPLMSKALIPMTPRLLLRMIRRADSARIYNAGRISLPWARCPGSGTSLPIRSTNHRWMRRAIS